ncbi:MAG TPA: NDP-sugar synthase [Methanomassiliicoccales archaeon]|nr:NDP-sugar synthase [Methanomassiliicoccales archaeon]
MIHGVEQAVVLVGGEGTRLRPLTNRRPKPLLPVLGRPCVEYSLRSLSAAGIGRVFLACGYRSDAIVHSLGNGSSFGVNMTYAFEDVPMGTAGAVKLLEPKLDDTIVVVMGDTLMDIDLAAIIKAHKRTEATVTIALTEVDRPTEFGIVGLDDAGRIVRFKEKPKAEEVFSNLINAGVYVIQREAFEHVPANTKFDFSKNLFPKLLEEGYALFGSKLSGMWKDIGRPTDLLDANIMMAERRGTELSIPGAKSSGKILADDIRAEGAEIAGPAYFGEGVEIAAKASVSSSAIGARCRIGARSVVSGSLLLSGTTLGEGVVVEDSIVGDGCLVADGVSLERCVLGDGVTVTSGKRHRDLVLE